MPCDNEHQASSRQGAVPPPAPPRAGLLDGIGALLVIGGALAAVGAFTIPGMVETYAMAAAISLLAGVALIRLAKHRR